MIIGIVGTLGAGKGTVVEYLKQKGFAHYSISEFLDSVLKEKSVPSTRANLSALADEFSQEYEGGVLEVVNLRTQKEGVDNYILESIHREKEAEYLRSIDGLILGVDADTKVRFKRASKRQEGEKDNVTYEQFLCDLEREEEGRGSGTPNIRAVLNNADVVLNNDGTLEELHQQIDIFLEKHRV